MCASSLVAVPSTHACDSVSGWSGGRSLRKIDIQVKVNGQIPNVHDRPESRAQIRDRLRVHLQLVREKGHAETIEKLRYPPVLERVRDGQPEATADRLFPLVLLAVPQWYADSLVRNVRQTAILHDTLDVIRALHGLAEHA